MGGAFARRNLMQQVCIAIGLGVDRRGRKALASRSDLGRHTRPRNVTAGTSQTAMCMCFVRVSSLQIPTSDHEAELVECLVGLRGGEEGRNSFMTRILTGSGKSRRLLTNLCLSRIQTVHSNFY